MCLKTLGASLIISITKLSQYHLKSLTSRVLDEYIDIILNAVKKDCYNYKDASTTAVETEKFAAIRTSTTADIQTINKSEDVHNYGDNTTSAVQILGKFVDVHDYCDNTFDCGGAKRHHNHLISAVSTNTTAVITIQKSQHLILIAGIKTGP